MAMTMQKLASAIAKREGGKSQARIGDIRQILKIIVELDVEAANADVASNDRPMWPIVDSINKKIEKAAKKEIKKASKK